MAWIGRKRTEQVSYPATFFSERKSTALASAGEIVPWVLEKLDVNSVVDVGCGTGSWLSTFIQQGVNDVVGLDGPWVPEKDLEICHSKFVAVDFTKLETLRLNRRFDLVICLEVAEHLPAAHAAEFIDRLVELGPCILFSAAVPQQGGVGHYNEQWPCYWIDHFSRHRYLCADVVRGAFWDNPSVAAWYPQNAFFFVSKEAASKYSYLRTNAENSLAGKSVIHPRLYQQKLDELSNPSGYSLRAIAKVLPFLLKQALWRKLGSRL